MSHITQRILRWLNYSVIGASFISITCMLILRLVPTAWGWGFLCFSFLTIVSAIVGCISLKGFCYPMHMFLLITSICLEGFLFLLLITRPNSVLDKFQSKRSEYDGRVVLKVNAAVVLWIFCVQIFVMAIACVAHYCEPVDFYEDLEGNARRASLRKGRRLSRVQEESIADEEAEKEIKLATGAARLHKQMRDKYNKKKEHEQEVYDNVEI
ncbi:hypothetical protein KP509_28G015700 [Ceratopteris richardii]|nr:hypothetical protein KP509_28G015700 [Ceratopteris richardii]